MFCPFSEQIILDQNHKLFFSRKNIAICHWFRELSCSLQSDFDICFRSDQSELKCTKYILIKSTSFGFILLGFDSVSWKKKCVKAVVSNSQKYLYRKD